MKRLKAYVKRDRWQSLGIRDWGIPHFYAGKSWRTSSTENPVIVVMKSRTELIIMDVVFVEGRERFPKGVRKLFAQYAKQWPDSAHDILPWADLSDSCRIAMAKKALKENKKSQVKYLLRALFLNALDY